MEEKNGIIYAVGLGPGNPDLLSPKALQAIQKSDVVIGYKTYIEYIKQFLTNQEICSSGMTKEIDRCTMAFEKAETGKNVCVVSSGDAGIYGMAGLLFEIKEKEEFRNIRVKVIPGITAANAAAAVLGAPLMNDFAVISMSDLLTPAEIILQRIKTVADSDLVCVLYNPVSRKRKTVFNSSVRTFLSARGNTYVGIVKNATKDNEESFITTLKEINNYDIDMSTVVIVGNKNTVFKNNKLYTPRGYKNKYVENF